MATMMARPPASSARRLASGAGNKRAGALAFAATPSRPRLGPLVLSAGQLPQRRSGADVVAASAAAASQAAEPAPAATSPQPDGGSLWHQFAASSSGEWEGVCATFDGAGEPQQLPSNYVPDAYRDWGVELYDWQTVCSSRVTDKGYTYTVRRMMPTVGCEADAVAFLEEGSNLLTGTDWRAILANGSYVSGPAALPEDETQLSVEICLAAPPGGAGPDAAASDRYRYRLVPLMVRHWETKLWGLRQVVVHRERYDGPYRGVVELSGCGGGLRPFAKTPALAPEAIQGTWAAVSGVRVAAGATGPVPVHGERGEGAAGVFGDEGTEAGVAGARGGVVRLPLGLCLRWQVAGEGGAGVGVTIGLEAAALAAGEGAGRERAAGAARYVGGRLQHLAVGAERAQS